MRRSSILWGAVALGVSSGHAVAQEATTGPGTNANVSLPPVEVLSPKERNRGQPKSLNAQAQQSGQPQSQDGGSAAAGTEDVGASNVFTLGQLDMVGGTSISSEAMWAFSKSSLDAAVALAPGVNADLVGGPRNERNIYVRGFDRWQVPLSIDGIRVYLPADNRLDMARFLTPDVSEIEIAKGYTSVLNGPGGMGGAINLVSKKPSKASEAELQSGLSFGTDGRYEGYNTYGRVGTKQKGYYAQASGSFRDADGWTLSESFAPTQFEDGGLRNHSQTSDWNFSVKAGLTPNATDEYSINYSQQSGTKSTPLNVIDGGGNSPRYWDWPYWDMSSIYTLSHTKIGVASYVETKLYYNTFNNSINMYDNDNRNTLNSKGQTTGVRSFYDDWAGGGSLQVGSDLTTWDTLKASFTYRRDSHSEYNIYNDKPYPTGLCANGTPTPCVSEPTQTTVEDTYSVAIENTIHATRSIDVISGISYDWRNLYKAEDFDANSGKFINYALRDSDAINWQSAIVYNYEAAANIHFSFSSRTRFPTIFERFSTRFGTLASNPELAPEQATNYEIGWSKTFGPVNQASAAVFYSDVADIIQSIPVAGQNYSRSENAGDGAFYGVELAGRYGLSDALTAGGNLTWMQRDITNPANPAFQALGVPDWKGLGYVTWQAT